MLKVYHSNRLERLIERLTDSLRVPAADPFAPDIILVQSNGMRRWITMELARRLGVAANLQFPFPSTFIWETYRSLLPETPAESPFAVAMLVWRVLHCLDALADAPAFASLQGYLRNADRLERYQLAHAIAAALERYSIYRPDWIKRWEDGQDSHWQAALWRRLAADGAWHRVRVQQAFLARLAARKQRPAELPARIACFGIASLPVAYLEVLNQLAQWCDIQLYLLNPCRQYWGLIQAEREIARHATDADAEELYLETGNRLLASLGRQGRDFHHLIAEIDAHPVELFEDVAEDSLLHCLQADILDLHNRGRNHAVCRFDELSQPIPATPLAADDVSVQIHACHSPLREVEVLHDQLLALFQRYPDLEAGDVVVMTPDIELYAPAIRAVFTTAESERRIPFGVADRPLRAESALAAAFLSLLELPGGRFTVNRVMALLEAPVIQRRFGLCEADLPLIADWLRQTGVRWGIDGASRAALELPPTTEHTWKAGLERLLLGFALPAEGCRLYEQVLPFDAIEGESARIMGRLQHFARQLFELQHVLAGDKTVPAWRQVLQQLLDEFIAAADVHEQERETVRATLAKLEECAAQAGFNGAVPLAVVRAWLTQNLDEREGAEGFLSGGVTFCEMTPMRSIPFRVVCLLGLNHDSYPRPQRQVDFDLLTRYPRRGDRSHRQEDRYLFLEALLAARDALYISYVGSNIRDNAPIPPSVLVSELLDYIRQGFYPKDNPSGDPAALLVTRHPLQPFSRRYFEQSPEGGARLFSYSRLLGQAAREQGRGQQEAAPLFRRPLPEPEDEFRRLDLQALISFFHNPARYLLRNRLKVTLREGEPVLPTSEPFQLERFVEDDIRRDLLKLQLAGRGSGDILPIVRAKGLLPHGQIGQSLYSREARRVKPLLALCGPDVGQSNKTYEVDLSLGEFHLTGWLNQLSADGLLLVEAKPLSARYYLTLWIRHLALNCLKPHGVARISVWQGLSEEDEKKRQELGPVAEKGRLELGPVAEPEAMLLDLLRLYWDGLREPLQFFPRSALAYMLAGKEQDPLEQAHKRWRGGEKTWGESEDIYYRLAFRGRQPLDAEFAALSKRVFDPLLAHQVKGSTSP